MSGALLLAVIAVGLVVVGDRLLVGVARWMLTRELSWTRGELRLAAVTGHGLRGVTVTGVRLTRDGGRNTLTVDTVVARFSPRELLSRSARRIQRVRVVGLRIEVAPGEDGWPGFVPIQLDSALQGRRANGARGFAIDTLEVVDAAVRATNRDGVTLLALDSIQAIVSAIDLGPRPAFRLDRASARARPRGPAQGTLRVSARGALADGRARLDSLVARDPSGGRVIASGTVDLAGWESGLALRVTGTGAHLSQLDPLAGSLLVPSQRADLDLTVRGRLARPEVDFLLAFADAGRMRAESRITVSGDTTVLDLAVDFEELDVTRLSGGRYMLDPVRGRVRGRFDVTTLDSVDGTLTVDVRSRAAGQAIGLTGGAEFRRGDARVALDATLRELRAHVTGAVRPIGATRYDLEARLRTALSLPPLMARRVPEWQGPWDVHLRLRGTGFSRDRAAAIVEGTVATVGDAAGRGSGTLRAEVARGFVALESQVELVGVTIEGRADAGLHAPRSSWCVSQVTVRGVALSPWLPVDDAGSLHATLRARAGRTGIAGTVRVDSVVGGHLAGLTAAIDFDRVGHQPRLSGRIVLGKAAVIIDSLQLFGFAPERGEVTFREVDPSHLLPSLPAAVLNGHLSLEPAPYPSPGDIRRPTTVSAAHVVGRLVLVESSLGRRPVSGTVDFRYLAGEFAMKGRFDGALHGGVEATASGPLDLSRAVADVRVLLDSARIRGLRVDRGDWSLRLRDGGVRVEGTGRAQTVAAVVRGDVHLEKNGRWRGTGVLVLRDTMPALPDSLLVRFELSSPDSSSHDPWEVAAAGAGTIVGLTFDTLALDVAFGDGMLVVNRLVATGPDLDARGTGHAPIRAAPGRRANLAVTGSVPGLGAVLAAFGRTGYRGRAAFSVRSTGSDRAIRHRVTVGIGNLKNRTVEIDSLTVDVIAWPDSTAWLSGATATVAVGGRRVAMVSPGGLPVLAGIGTGTRGLGTTTRATAAAAWSADGALQISALHAQFGEERWILDRPATVLLGETIEVRDLTVTSSEGSVVVAGHLTRHGGQDLALTVKRLPVQLLARGANTALAGRLSLALRLSGSTAAPHLTLDGMLDEVAGLAGTTIAADWTDRRLQLRVANPGVLDGRLEMNGTLPLGIYWARGHPSITVTDDSLDLHLESADFDLSTIAPALDDLVSGLQGRLQANIVVTGVLGAPRFAGRAAVEGLGLRIAAFGTVLAADRLAATFAERRLTIVEGTMRGTRRGTLEVRGGVEFPTLTRPVFDLTAAFDRFPAADYGKLQATVSGRLALRGSATAPEVTGELRADQAVYRASLDDLPGEFADVQLTEADYREVERRFGVYRETNLTVSRLWSASTLDVTVRAQSNVWVRRTYEPALAVEIAGTVRGRKAAAGPLLADGELHVVEGRSSVQEFGRHFVIERGTARFNGPIAAVEVDGQASYRPDDDVTIRLNVRGNLEGLTLTLSSEPEMDETDIISYIAVGRPASDASPPGVDDPLASSGPAFALSRVTAGVQDLARRRLGLDVAEVHQDGIRGLTLVAGYYVTRRLYLGFEQPISFHGRQSARAGHSDTEIEAEYRATTWLLMNLSGSRSLARFFLTTRHAY